MSTILKKIIHSSGLSCHRLLGKLCRLFWQFKYERHSNRYSYNFRVILFSGNAICTGYHRLAKIYFILFLGILIWWLFFVTPSNERQWQSDAAGLAYATVEGDLVTVHNVRNFDYKSETNYTINYYAKTYDLNNLEGVDLIAVYWMGPAIAHTILSFNFADKDYHAVSIEARKEIGEGYSSIKGFFRQYELIYIVADERDVVRLRTNYRKASPEDVYLYRVKVPKENARRFF